MGRRHARVTVSSIHRSQSLVAIHLAIPRSSFTFHRKPVSQLHSPQRSDGKGCPNRQMARWVKVGRKVGKAAAQMHQTDVVLNVICNKLSTNTKPKQVFFHPENAPLNSNQLAATFQGRRSKLSPTHRLCSMHAGSRCCGRLLLLDCIPAMKL